MTNWDEKERGLIRNPLKRCNLIISGAIKEETRAATKEGLGKGTGDPFSDVDEP